MVVLAPGLHMVDPSLSPPLTPAAFFGAHIWVKKITFSDPFSCHLGDSNFCFFNPPTQKKFKTIIDPPRVKGGNPNFF